jgi:hypothetical protein
MKPRVASGVIGGTTTICAQQQRHPSPEPPSLVSGVLWLEKMQESGEMSWQAKISVAARSSTRSVTTRRVVGQLAMKSYSIAILEPCARALAALVTYPGFPAFLYQKVDDGERGQRIDPPGPQGELGGQAKDDDEG